MDRVESKNSVSNGHERMLINRLVEREIEPEMAMKITALWMSFETQGYEEKLMSIISENDDEVFFSSFLEESMAILAILDPSSSTTPFSATVVDPGSVSLSKIFNDHRERVLKGMGSLSREIHGIGNEEEKVAEEEREKNCNQVDEDGDGSCSKRRSVLNPFAKEWNPELEVAPEESRSLFLTFSNGYPLTKRQIIDFFSRKYGPCIERVYIHYPEDGSSPPLFGKVIFTAMLIAAMVLAGEEEAKFIIDRRALWCKKYEPRRIRPASR